MHEHVFKKAHLDSSNQTNLNSWRRKRETNTNIETTIRNSKTYKGGQTDKRANKGTSEQRRQLNGLDGEREENNKNPTILWIWLEWRM